MIEGNVIAARTLRVREEDFGYIVARPDGDIDIYDRSAADLLARDQIDVTELDAHRLRRLEYESHQFHLRHPLIVTIELSTTCELRCKHCYIDAGESRSDELTEKELYALLDDLHRAGVFCVQFIGGEPLEHPSFLPLLEYAHELGFVLSFVTNGLRLTPEVVARLPRKDFGMGLSIDGIEANEKIRGHEARFEVLAEKALMLKEAGVEFNVIFALNKLNIDESTRLVQWCRDHDIMLESLETQMLGRAKYSHPLHLSPNDLAKDLEFYNAKEELEDYFEECVDPRQRLYYAGFLQLAYWFDSLTRRCKGARSIAYISANGEVYPCSNCAAEEILSAGNIRTLPFSVLWAHSFLEMRSITWEKFDVCDGCALSQPQYSCSGRCPALSHSLNKTYTECGATPYTRAIVKGRTEVYLDTHALTRHDQPNPARVVRVVGGRP